MLRHVTLQPGVGHEALRAKRAAIAEDASVPVDVHLQTPLGGDDFVADRAPVAITLPVEFRLQLQSASKRVVHLQYLNRGQCFAAVHGHASTNRFLSNLHPSTSVCLRRFQVLTHRNKSCDFLRELLSPHRLPFRADHGQQTVTYITAICTSVSLGKTNNKTEAPH